MNRELRERFELLRKVYFGLSIVGLVIALVMIIFFYLTSFKDNVTIAHLFLVTFTLILTMYFRINALHYQEILMTRVRRDEAKPARKKGEPLRKGGRVSEQKRTS